MGEQVACLGQKERNLLENVSFDGKLILKWMLNKLTGRGWTGFIWEGLASLRWLSPALYTEMCVPLNFLMCTEFQVLIPAHIA
jgi:hypothetical protein